MIYSKKHKFLFISVPKTGTSSIQAMLVEQGVGKQNRFEIDGVETVLSDHVSAQEMKDLLGDEWDSLTKVAFARNPWDKVLSSFYYNKQGLVDRYERKGKKPPFYQFKKLLSSLMPFRLWACFYPTRPCCHFIADANGAILVDYVFAFEQIEQAKSEICQLLGLPEVPLPKENVSVGRPKYVAAYGAISKWLVARRLKRDIDAFAYAFDKIPASPKLYSKI